MDDCVKDLALKALQNLEKHPCNSAVPNLEHSISKVASKIPALGHLEKKLGLMKDLHPELESINNELRDITSNVDMKAAKEGGRLIKKVLKVPEAVHHEVAHHHHHHHHHHYGVPATHVVHHHHHGHIDSAKVAAKAVKSIANKAIAVGKVDPVKAKKMVEAAGEAALKAAENSYTC